MRTVVTTPAAFDPISVQEARDWLNFVDNVTEENAVIRRLIRQVSGDLQAYTNRYISTQTVTVYLDANEITSPIYLGCVPLVSVSSIVTTDDDGDDTTVTSTNYQVRAGENPRITLTWSGSWPTDIRAHDGMAITCVCGSNGNTVPYVGFEPLNQTDESLDDMTAGGTFTGTLRTMFELRIDTAATPDVFAWRKLTWDTDGVMTATAWSSGANITGAAQTLTDGITATWSATTGHTADSGWTIEIFERVYRRLPGDLDLLFLGLITHSYLTKGQGVTETVSGQLIGIPNHLRAKADSLRVTPWVSA